MTVPPPPPPLESLPAGSVLVAGLGAATVLPDFDFETYSEAGYVWDGGRRKWSSLPGYGDQNRGLPAVGAAVYTEHPSCEVLSLAYDLKDGHGRRHWKPGDLPPLDLFLHIARGGLLEAWNVGFESWVWDNVCTPRMGWPALPREQLRCAMAKARSHALPGALGKAGDVLALPVQKDKDGGRLLDKFSKPRNPTKADPRLRIRPEEDPEDAARLYGYNVQDIAAEAAIAAVVPDMPPEELDNWRMDQRINRRGVAIDRDRVRDCIAVLQQAHARYNEELRDITGGAVQAASETERLQAWCAGAGFHIAAMDEDTVTAALAGVPPPPPHIARALEIRQAIGSAAVKKLFAMEHQATRANRLHDLFLFHAARTGRTTGTGPQPTNLPNSGPDVLHCGDATCGKFYGARHTACPHCGADAWASSVVEWNAGAVETALEIVSYRSLELCEYVWGVGQAVKIIAACLRGLFVAAPGHELICSDYSAIEAVGLAALAGEEWRLEVFRTHGKIYEMSASSITGIPFDDFIAYKRDHGTHHPMRKKVGKVAELASGYQGWVGAWRAFGAEGSDEEIKRAILNWRTASPSIVEFWGGQFRGRPWDPDYRQEYFGIEGAVVQAILYPRTWFSYRAIGYYYHGDVLYCRLLSGRLLTYHRPRLAPSTRDAGYSISYEGYNTNPKNGPVGWIRMNTWGGRLTENIVQATCRDIQWYGMRALEARGYPIVLHVYDEDVAEVPQGAGSVEEFEAIMSTMPPWAADWPIRASGGWRGRRYRK